MWILIAVGALSVAIGLVLGWLLGRTFSRIELPEADETTPAAMEPILNEEIEERIDSLSTWLARREGRMVLKPLFASKLRLAYRLRDLPRERKENS